MLGSVTEGGLVQIDPKHLMIIAEISDAGGFTEAAISLGTSQPAISRVVKMLEQRLGEPIFHRVRKPLQLTSAGAVLADQGRAIRKAALRASDELDWTIGLVLRADQVPHLKLGRQGRLGWTTWLGRRPDENDAGDLTLTSLNWKSS
jgi:DNA-binding transcriptional LysR family regulator